MTELCLECINKLNNTIYTENDITLTTEEKDCDGCFRRKRIVAFLSKPNIFTPIKLAMRKSRVRKSNDNLYAANDIANKKWDELWKMVYDFQATIPDGIEPGEKADKLGLTIILGAYGEPLFVDENLSHKLFMYRISH